MSKSWPKTVALINTHIPTYEVMKLETYQFIKFKDVMFLCEKTVSCKEQM